MIRSILLKTFIIFAAVTGTSSDVFGFSYESYIDGHTTIHVLTVNPQEHKIMPVKATGEIVKRETVLQLSNQHGAVAAVNGGFWKDDGSPSGILKIAQQWYGTPVKPRAAIGWKGRGENVIIDRVMTDCDLNSCLDEKLIEILPVSDLSKTTTEQWKEMEHIVGGTPLLISMGHVVTDYSSERTMMSFLTKKHPRTAVGVKEDGDWIFVVVDGRYCGLLGGMTIRELADFMWDLGCVEALNLDGGGSSTLVLEGTVVNEPCGELEENNKLVEAVSDAILILPSDF